MDFTFFPNEVHGACTPNDCILHYSLKLPEFHKDFKFTKNAIQTQENYKFFIKIVQKRKWSGMQFPAGNDQNGIEMK